jgi:hypothetical protein
MFQEYSGRKIQFGQIDRGDLAIHRNLSWINAARWRECEISCFIRRMSRNMSSCPLIIQWSIYRQIPVVLMWYLCFAILKRKECLKKLIVGLSSEFSYYMYVRSTKLRNLVHHCDMRYDFESRPREISCMALICDLKLNAQNLVGPYKLKREIWAKNIDLWHRILAKI